MIRPIFRERAKINAEVTGRLTESLGGVRVVKGYHAEEREHEVFSSGVERLLQNVFKTLTATSVMSLSSSTLMGVIGAIVMFMGTRQILAGKLTLGGFFTYTMFLGYLAAPLFQVVGIGTQITEAIAGLERTREVLDETPENEDPERTVTLAGDSRRCALSRMSPSPTSRRRPCCTTSRSTPQPGHGDCAGWLFRLGQVHHHRLDCRVPQAQRGQGAGGRRRSCDRAAGVLPHAAWAWCCRIRSCSTARIRENVAFSKPDATEAEILRACAIARVDEFAERFELKYDTIIGERGVKLSGGQRQRVSIARAILANPRILILDEATSSLDSESEALIQQGLSYLMQGRTTFVIAHRLSTIRRADQILVVEAGEIVERGTHESLFELGGRYYELYTAARHRAESVSCARRG